MQHSYFCYFVFVIFYEQESLSIKISPNPHNCHLYHYRKSSSPETHVASIYQIHSQTFANINETAFAFGKLKLTKQSRTDVLQPLEPEDKTDFGRFLK